MREGMIEGGVREREKEREGATERRGGKRPVS